MTDFPCRECGHPVKMHVRGTSPRYTGCTVRFMPCPCRLTPEEAKAAASPAEKETRAAQR